MWIASGLPTIRAGWAQADVDVNPSTLRSATMRMPAERNPGVLGRFPPEIYQAHRLIKPDLR
jgi:hypothetical protein